MSRCYCGRPINDPGGIECAEHDSPGSAQREPGLLTTPTREARRWT